MTEHGPYRVTGGPPLVRLARDDRGGWIEGERLEAGDAYMLCRCGRSATLPFCDRGESCREAPAALVRVPRPVSWDVPTSSPCVGIKPNGPLRVRGLRLEADDGAEFEQADRCSLCRCGNSGTMPFCDGSHKEAGFRG